RGGAAAGDRGVLASRLQLPVHRPPAAGVAEPVAGAPGSEPGLPLLRTQPPPLLQLRLGPGRSTQGGGVRLTLVHPCIGRRRGQPSIRTWQMEPLPPALIAGLTPPDVDLRFYDDRMEDVPFDEPTDLVALSVETYTAKRAYQIASEYRRRGVPVVMGGFHAS